MESARGCVRESLNSSGSLLLPAMAADGAPGARRASGLDAFSSERRLSCARKRDGVYVRVSVEGAREEKEGMRVEVAAMYVPGASAPSAKYHNARVGPGRSGKLKISPMSRLAAQARRWRKSRTNHGTNHANHQC